MLRRYDYSADCYVAGLVHLSKRGIIAMHRIERSTREIFLHSVYRDFSFDKIELRIPLTRSLANHEKDGKEKEKKQKTKKREKKEIKNAN